MLTSNKFSRLYFITLEGIDFSPEDQVAEFCKGGGRFVQIRLKNGRDQTIRNTAERCLEICREYGALCIMNDRLELAATLGFDGIHLGQNDESPKRARTILGEKAIIGGTANNLAEAKKMIEQGVDYLGVGPFRFTTTKQNLSPVLGVSGYKKIVEDLRIQDIKTPVFAIGGIRSADVDDLMQTGVFGIALSGDLALAENTTHQTETYLTLLNTFEEA